MVEPWPLCFMAAMAEAGLLSMAVVCLWLGHWRGPLCCFNAAALHVPLIVDGLYEDRSRKPQPSVVRLGLRLLFVVTHTRRSATPTARIYTHGTHFARAEHI